jgi:ankyrin repeat protein
LRGFAIYLPDTIFLGVTQIKSAYKYINMARRYTKKCSRGGGTDHSSSMDPTMDLLIAAEENNVANAKAAIAGGADVNGKYNVMTPLILACKNNNMDIVELLLSNPDVRINEELASPDRSIRQNALDAAVLDAQDEELVEYLLAYGAEPIHSFVRTNPVYLRAKSKADQYMGGKKRRTRKGRKSKKAHKSRRMHKKSRRT